MVLTVAIEGNQKQDGRLSARVVELNRRRPKQNTVSFSFSFSFFSCKMLFVLEAEVCFLLGCSSKKDLVV